MIAKVKTSASNNSNNKQLLTNLGDNTRQSLRAKAVDANKKLPIVWDIEDAKDMMWDAPKPPAITH